MSSRPHCCNGSVVLLQLHSVLMSMVDVTTGGHSDHV